MNRKFRRDYDRLFRKDPAAANLYLLLNELADESGQVEATEKELLLLMMARFNDPLAYQFNEVTP
jgi:hypothetical protein